MKKLPYLVGTALLLAAPVLGQFDKTLKNGRYVLQGKNTECSVNVLETYKNKKQIVCISRRPEGRFFARGIGNEVVETVRCNANSGDPCEIISIVPTTGAEPDRMYLNSVPRGSYIGDQQQHLYESLVMTVITPPNFVAGKK